jgi:hypothetical protein
MVALRTEHDDNTGIPALMPLPDALAHDESTTLYIILGADGSFKAGTCHQCVVCEQARPERAWKAEDDAQLDFERDTLFGYLAELGVQITERHAYVCP